MIRPLIQSVRNCANELDMLPAHWIMLLALLAQVCARAANSSIDETSTDNFVDCCSSVDEDDQSYTLEQLVNGDNTEYEQSVTEWETETDGYSTEEAVTSASNSTIPHSELNPPISSNNTAREGRILGGTDATAGQFGYYVYVEGTPATGTTVRACGGALLSEVWVLTAAQCVVTMATVTVYAGVVVSPTASTMKSTASIYIHPNFKRNFMINDIALLRLFTPLTIAANVATIRLSGKDPGAGLDNVAVRTFGFGVANNDVALAMAPQMKYVDLVHLKKSTCLTQTQETYVSYPQNTGCIATSSATKGFCYGDTGGPVIFTSDADTTAKVIGVNSQYLGCPSSYPSSYTKIYPFLGWIKSVTRKNFT